MSSTRERLRTTSFTEICARNSRLCKRCGITWKTTDATEKQKPGYRAGQPRRARGPRQNALQLGVMKSEFTTRLLMWFERQDRAVQLAIDPNQDAAAELVKAPARRDDPRGGLNRKPRRAAVCGVDRATAGSHPRRQPRPRGRRPRPDEEEEGVITSRRERGVSDGETKARARRPGEGAEAGGPQQADASALATRQRDLQHEHGRRRSTGRRRKTANSSTTCTSPASEARRQSISCSGVMTAGRSGSSSGSSPPKSGTSTRSRGSEEPRLPSSAPSR